MGSDVAENPLLEEEEEEALSLRDLPTDEENHAQVKALLSEGDDDGEEFNFLQFSKDSKMCAADEVFFQGQILPKMLAGSTSSTCFSRSGSNQSMDNFTSASSRSSSINSHRSSSSGSSSSFSSATNAAARPPRRPKLHNQFQFSHPSPKPKPHVKPPIFKTGGKPNRNPPAPSTIWSFLRVGLVAPPPPEIKLRSKSLNSTSGTKEATADKKQQSSKFPGKSQNKNRVLFSLSGCNCTANAVVGPVPSAPLNAITRNPTAKEEDNSVELKKKRIDDDDDKNRGTTRKQSASRHRRTFEWLKQLSLEEETVALVIDDHDQQQRSGSGSGSASRGTSV